MAMSGYSHLADVFVHAVRPCHIPARGIMPRLGRAPVWVVKQFFLAVSFVLIANASVAVPPPVNPADAVAFIEKLWGSARDVLNQKADPALRRAQFAELFHEDFDGPGIARFVVGRYWRTASQEEQQEFLHSLKTTSCSCTRLGWVISAASALLSVAAEAMVTG
jgi:hypothetical protein